MRRPNRPGASFDNGLIRPRAPFSRTMARELLDTASECHASLNCPRLLARQYLWVARTRLHRPTLATVARILAGWPARLLRRVSRCSLGRWRCGATRFG